MGPDDAFIERVSVERVDPGVAGPYEPGDSQFTVAVSARAVTGRFGPVDELPAVLIATRLGQAAIGHLVADHVGLLHRLIVELGAHGAGLGRWAVGALDCAVWDLHGRLADLPVAALLSDRPTRRVPAYGSWLSLDLQSQGSAEWVRRTAGEGFAFTKWGLRSGPDARELAGLAEQATVWAGHRVAVDAVGTWGHFVAAGAGPFLSQDVVRWVEDPLPRTDLAAYTHLRQWAPRLPIAYGERLVHAEDAVNLLHQCRPAAFTFDVAWCGGITEARTWLAAAQEEQVPVHLHGRAFVPAVHLAAAYPGVADAVEYQIEWEPRRQRALREPLRPADGHVTVPDGPGLGVEVLV
ncbi:enolase C-terminal domain-like protein [Streptomyces sp. NPDC054835]|uniref:enolase C-terminal domain-like protein n=1 Tax=Streptomyces exfoliatus TaxID=1905 RepID=UPI0004641C8A|nr:enolase C-terminal domain-like protein [Streptomyces exfoliatus]